MSRRCVLDLAKLRSTDAIYDALSAGLDLPDYFGRNLDALWDVLLRQVPGPVVIKLENAGASPPDLRPFVGRLQSLLRDAAKQRADLRLIEE